MIQFNSTTFTEQTSDRHSAKIWGYKVPSPCPQEAHNLVVFWVKETRKFGAEQIACAKAKSVKEHQAKGTGTRYTSPTLGVVWAGDTNECH